MECRGRRRRGRGRSCHSPNNSCASSEFSKPWSFLSGFASFIILSSLIGVIYLMLEYHCNTCSSKCDLNNINKSIEDIAKNLAVMKHSYYDLELKISRFSHELPKLEGQIEILEAIANAIESKDPGWDPRAHLDHIFQGKHPNELRGNLTKCKCSKQSPPKVTVD